METAIAARINTKSLWESKEYGQGPEPVGARTSDPLPMATVEFLKPLLPVLRGKTVLDLGCGSGYLTPQPAPACDSGVLGRATLAADRKLTTFQLRSGHLNNWSYTQTLYASHSARRSSIFQHPLPTRTEGNPDR